MERQAKIVATLGPASSDEWVIARLLDAGLDVVRLNFSHGDHASHRRAIANVRRVAAEQGRFVPIFVDLMGPRYRLGQIPDGRVLVDDEEVVLGEESDLPVEDPGFLAHVRPGERMLVDNGLLELEILDEGGRKVRARVLHGGPVSTRKGINLPDTDLPFTISAKDHADVAFAIGEGVDYIAVSFVGGPEDLRAVRDVMEGVGRQLPLIAKLERAAVMRRLAETVREADAVMVARGDLGVEVPLHQVPVWQKKIIRTGRRFGKPVIVATQMLESMMEQPRPTRAEASDVANAVFDSADALMLSGETAAGQYPVEAVRTMCEVILEAESYEMSRPPAERESLATRPTPSADGAYAPLLPGVGESDELNDGEVPLGGPIPEVVAAAAVGAADRLGARRIVAFSQGGFTARTIARYRPQPPITVITPDARVARRLGLVWGARPLLMDEHEVHHHDEVVRAVDQMLLDARLADPGDTIILLMGDPIAQKPLTCPSFVSLRGYPSFVPLRGNLMRVHRVRAHPQDQPPDPEESDS